MPIDSQITEGELSGLADRLDEAAAPWWFRYHLAGDVATLRQRLLDGARPERTLAEVIAGYRAAIEESDRRDVPLRRILDVQVL